MREVTDARGIWAAHSESPPSWASCPDDPLLEEALARHFGCERGEPKDVEATHHTGFGPPGTGPDGPVSKRGGGDK